MKSKLLLCALLGTLLFGESAPERLAVVPRENLPPLLLQQSRRMLMPLAEYREWIRRVEAEAPARAPHGAVLNHMDLQIRLGDDLAHLEATATVEGLRPGLHALNLGTAGVFWTHATLEGQPAELGGEPGGALTVFLEGEGVRELRLRGTVPLSRRNHLQHLDFTLPDSPVSIRLTAAGEIEIAEGVSVAGRVFDAAADETRFTLHPRDRNFAAAFRVNRLLRDTPRRVEAVVAHTSVLHLNREQVYASIRLGIFHQPLRQLRLRVPADLTLLAVSGTGISSWRIEEAGAAPVLRVDLAEDVLGSLDLHLHGSRPSAAAEIVGEIPLMSWSPPRFEVIDADAHTRVVGLRLMDGLRVVELNPGQFRNLGAADGRRLLPSGAGIPGAFSAWFAPGDADPITASFYQPGIHVGGVVNLRLSLTEEAVELEGDVVLLARGAPIHDSGFLLPRAWNIRSVTDDKDVPLRHEVFEAAEGQQRVQVTLPAGVPPGVPASYRFTARRVPAGWLDSGGAQAIVFPEFRLHQVDEFSGAVALEALGELSLGATEVTGLTPLDENEKALAGLRTSENAQAWRFEQPGFTLEVESGRREAELQAETFTFLRVEGDRIRIRYELLYSVRRARAREVEFSLPGVLPVTVSPRGEKGGSIEEVRRRVEEGREVWTVRIGAGIGSAAGIHLSLETDVPLELDRPFVVPVPRAEGVEIQSGYVTIEGAAELEITLENAPREVDVGETADAVYLPGPRLLGAHVFLGEAPDMILRAGRHPLAAVPTSLVTRLELGTRLSAGGTALHEAAFFVENAPPFVTVSPPAGARVWAVRVDGGSVEPREGGDGNLLVPLPAERAGETREVRVVYETRVDKPGLRERLRMDAPKLSLHRSGETSSDLTTTVTHWTLSLPTGFDLVDSRGTATPVREISTAPVAAARTGQALWNFFGGFRAVASRSRLASDAKMLGGAVYDSEMQGMAAPDSSEWFMADEIAMEDGRVAPPAVIRPPASRPAPSPRAPAPEYRKEQEAAKPVTGFRSLSIQLDPVKDGLRFQQLGGDAELDVTLVNADRFTSLALAAALGVFVAGLALFGRRARLRKSYVLCVLLGATMLAALPGLHAYARVFNAAFYSALWLIPLYLVAKGLHKLRSALFPAALLLVFAAIPGTLRADDVPPPLPIPANLLVQPAGGTDVLVPLEQVQKLWERLQELENPASDPVPGVTWLGAVTEATLDEAETLTLQTTLRFRVREGNTPDAPGLPVIPLTLKNGVLTRATLDNVPARFRREADTLEVIVDTPGVKELRLWIQVAVEERGEGRVAAVELPPVPGHRVELTVAPANTELTVRSERVPRVVRTREAGQVVTLVPAADGRVDVAWRPADAIRVGDSSLQAESLGVLDLRDDLALLGWDLRVAVRGEPVSHLDLTLPAGWSLGLVEGANLRGWEPLESGLVRMHFTRPADREIHLRMSFAKAPAGGPGETQWTEALPGVEVPAALRHNGLLLLRRLPRLEVRVGEMEGLRREEMNLQPFAELAASLPLITGTPLPFQVYRFHSPGYRMVLEVKREETRLEAQWERIFRVARRERILEARCRIRVEGQPAHQLRFQLPAGMEIDSVHAPGDFLWHAETEGEAPSLTLFSGTGWTERVDVVITAREHGELGADPLQLPDLRLLNAPRQTGQWVVQSDPFYTVEAEDRLHVELIPLRDTFSWLTAPQRPTSQLALAFSRPDHQARLSLVRRPAVITSTTFTNLRVTDRVIEETLLLDFRISGSGAREFVFQVPAHLAEARLRVPLLRRHRVTPVADRPGWLEMRVELQDEVMNQLLILLEHDRTLEAGPIQAWSPAVLTGREGRGFITLENAGRDEVVIDGVEGLEALTRQHPEWRQAAARVAGHATYAFITREQVSRGRLEFRTAERLRVRTAGAGIGLAAVTLVMDEFGSYRAKWTGQVDNRTEQFLVMTLPAGSRLLGAAVAGRRVRPVQDPGAPSNQIRIPLVKTAAGELDVPVEVVYGGRITDMAVLRREGFPFPATVNVAVELSQAELHLPRRRHFFRFDGTMRQVEDRAEYEVSLLKYQTDVVDRLSQTLLTGGEYERARARRNVAVLSGKVAESSQRQSGPQGREDVARALEAVRQAESNLEGMVQQAGMGTVSLNRVTFNNDFDTQSNAWGHNQVLRNPGNFAVEVPVGSSVRQQQQAEPVVQDYNQLRQQNVSFRGRTGREAGLSKLDVQNFSRGQQEMTERYLERLEEAAPEGEADAGAAGDVLASLMPVPDASLTRVHRFTTPRGDMRVTAWSLSARDRQVLERLASFLAALLISALLLLRRRSGGGKPMTFYAPLWMFLGIVLLLTGILWILGAALIVYALFGFRKRWKATPRMA